MKPTSLALLGLAALPLVLGAYVQRREGEPRTLTVTARDYALDLPDTLPEGAVTLRLVNQGKEFHHVWIARLEGGHTMADVQKALERRAGFPEWLRHIGGPNAPGPRAVRRAPPWCSRRDNTSSPASSRARTASRTS